MEEDYFSKFVFEYLAFIAYAKTQLYQNTDSDRRVIQKLKVDDDIKEKYLRQIRSNPTLKGDWKHIKKKLDRVRLGNTSRDLSSVEEIEWWNCEQKELSQKTPAEKEKVGGVIHSLDDWGNMVEFWYSIRNNLFHGAKNPENERDQFAVKYGYKTLKELMEILINERE